MGWPPEERGHKKLVGRGSGPATTGLIQSIMRGPGPSPVRPSPRRSSVPSVSTFAESLTFDGGDEIDVEVPGPGVWAWWFTASCSVDVINTIDLPQYVPVQIQLAATTGGGTAWSLVDQIMASTTKTSAPSGVGGGELSGWTAADTITVGASALWDDASFPGLPTFPGSAWTATVRGLWLRAE